jgi:hypothetical protein
MAKPKFKSYNIVFISIIVILIIIILGLVLYYFNEKNKINIDNVSDTSNTSFNSTNTNASFNNNAYKQHDENVLYNPLYPPTNRTESSIYNNMDHEIKNKNMYVPTQSKNDNYRMVGYLVSQEGNDSGGNNWKLFAKQKNNNNADFYMIPANNNYDIKIPINNDIVIGSNKLRDVYTIPEQLKFDSPLLSKNNYEFIELPKSDLSDPRYI